LKLEEKPTLDWDASTKRTREIILSIIAAYQPHASHGAIVKDAEDQRISERTVDIYLRRLVKDGLVERVIGETPSRKYYTLSKKHADVRRRALFIACVTWAENKQLNRFKETLGSIAADLRDAQRRQALQGKRGMKLITKSLENASRSYLLLYFRAIYEYMQRRSTGFDSISRDYLQRATDAFLDFLSKDFWKLASENTRITDTVSSLWMSMFGLPPIVGKMWEEQKEEDRVGALEAARTPDLLFTQLEWILPLTALQAELAEEKSTKQLLIDVTSDLPKDYVQDRKPNLARVKDLENWVKLYEAFLKQIDAGLESTNRGKRLTLMQLANRSSKGTGSAADELGA
jgi:DNA-binding PadR family transcriptional regulator